MRRLIALALVVMLTFAITAPAAEAGHHVAVGIGTAVGLALFAPFIIVGSILAPLVHHPPVYAAPAVSVPPTVVAPAPPASSPTTVQYPHGRYELRGDGIRTAYQWVWIPNPPPPPPVGPPQSQ